MDLLLSFLSHPCYFSAHMVMEIEGFRALSRFQFLMVALWLYSKTFWIWQVNRSEKAVRENSKLMDRYGIAPEDCQKILESLKIQLTRDEEQDVFILEGNFKSPSENPGSSIFPEAFRFSRQTSRQSVSYRRRKISGTQFESSNTFFPGKFR